MQYELYAATSIQVTIFDVSGRRLNVLADEVQAAGSHTLVWDGQTEQDLMVDAGIYFAQITAGQQTQIIKLTYVK